MADIFCPKLKLPIYLDYNSTTPLDPEALEKMLPLLGEKFGNYSSRSHLFGWEASEIVEKARHQVSNLIGADPSEIVWTSGATEANNLAIRGIARAKGTGGRHIITVETEHKAVLDVCEALESEGFAVSYLEVRTDGTLDPRALEAAFQPNTVLVSVMIVNHELGVVQNVGDLSKLCQSRKVPLHVDASQAAGKVAINVTEVSVSALSLSSHKSYGPKGVGALYLNRQNDFQIEPLIRGGGQEKNIRSGTLPSHQIVGMGTAFLLISRTSTEEVRRIKKLGAVLVGKLSFIRHVRINGHLRFRIPHSINLSFSCVEGESLILSLKNVAISSGSACTSASLEPSYVLLAIGCGSEAHNSVRISVGRFTSVSDVSYTTRTVAATVRNLRHLSPVWEESRLDGIQ